MFINRNIVIHFYFVLGFFLALQNAQAQTTSAIDSKHDIFESMVQNSDLVATGQLKAIKMKPDTLQRQSTVKTAFGEIVITEVIYCRDSKPPKTIPFETETGINVTGGTRAPGPWVTAPPKVAEKVFLIARKAERGWWIKDIQKAETITAEQLRDIKNIVALIHDKQTQPAQLLVQFFDYKRSKAVRFALLRKLSRQFPGSPELLEALIRGYREEDSDARYLAGELSLGSFSAYMDSNPAAAEALLNNYLTLLNEYSVKPESVDFRNMMSRLQDSDSSRKALEANPRLAAMVLQTLEKLPPEVTPDNEVRKEILQSHEDLKKILRKAAESKP